ncbi:MAG: hypothetical protein EZS28_013591, partial [Streblomastix strix]
VDASTFPSALLLSGIFNSGFVIDRICTSVSLCPTAPKLAWNFTPSADTKLKSLLFAVALVTFIDAFIGDVKLVCNFLSIGEAEEECNWNFGGTTEGNVFTYDYINEDELDCELVGDQRRLLWFQFDGEVFLIDDGVGISIEGEIDLKF